MARKRQSLVLSIKKKYIKKLEQNLLENNNKHCNNTKIWVIITKCKDQPWMVKVTNQKPTNTVDKKPNLVIQGWKSGTTSSYNKFKLTK